MKSFDFAATRIEEKKSFLVYSEYLATFDTSTLASRYISSLSLRAALTAYTGTNSSWIKCTVYAWDANNGAKDSFKILDLSETVSDTLSAYERTLSLNEQDYASNATQMATAREKIGLALANGFYIYAEKRLRTSAGITLHLDTYQGKITPEGSKYTSGSLQKGGK